MHDYCKSNQPISLELDVMIGPNNRRNWLTFAGDPVPDTAAATAAGSLGGADQGV